MEVEECWNLDEDAPNELSAETVRLPEDFPTIQALKRKKIIKKRVLPPRQNEVFPETEMAISREDRLISRQIFLIEQNENKNKIPKKKQIVRFSEIQGQSPESFWLALLENAKQQYFVPRLTKRDNDDFTAMITETVFKEDKPKLLKEEYSLFN